MDINGIWVNYNISLTWIKAILGWFPLLTMIPVRSQWGRYNLTRWYPIHSWMVKKSWYFMDIHECKWMRTGGTLILGNHHIYIYIYLFVCLLIWVQAGKDHHDSSCHFTGYLLQNSKQPTVPGLTPPTTSHNMISLVTCPSGCSKILLTEVARCYRNMYNYKYVYIYIYIYIQTIVVMQSYISIYNESVKSKKLQIQFIFLRFLFSPVVKRGNGNPPVISHV